MKTQPALKIVQISDCHLFADPTKTAYGEINPLRTLQRVLLEVKRLRPDLVLVTGDVSGDHSVQSYQHFSVLWQQSGITAKLLSIAGNHDNITAWQDCFEQQDDYACHTLVDGWWYLHLLPSDFEGANGRLRPKSVDSLLHKLKAQPQAQHMVVLHHPLTDSGVWMDRHNLINANLLTQHLASVNVTAVFHGHVHTDRVVVIHDTPVYACPSTCWQWGNSENFSVADQSAGYRLIELMDDTSWRTSIHYLPKSLI